MVKKITKIVIGTVFIIMLLLLGNIYIPQIASKYYNWTYVAASTDEPDSFEQLLRDGVIETIKNESWNVPLGSYQSLLQFLNGDISVYGYGEFGYLMHYAYLFGEEKKDSELTNLIKYKFDNSVLGGGIIRNDQTPYGLVAIDLYKDSHDHRYKVYADAIFNCLDSLDKEDGLVIYNKKHPEQRVDGIGLVCPFLYDYFSEFKLERSRQIADKMVRDFIRYGTDETNGVPAKAYGLMNHIKHISPNWGRGISWYLLGIMGSDSLDDECESRIQRLETELLKNGNCLYPQYFDEGEQPDMSSTIPVLWYLTQKGLLHLSRKDFTKIVSGYFDNDGIVRWCSPVVNSGKGVDNKTTNLFCQGLALYMMAELE